MYQEPLFLSLQETKPAGEGRTLSPSREAHSMARYAGHSQIHTVAHGQVARAAPSPWLPEQLWLPSSPMESQGSQEGQRMHPTAPLPPHAQHCAEGSASPIPCLLCSNPKRITVLKACLLHPEKGLRRREVTCQGPCRLCPTETRPQDIAASGARGGGTPGKVG